MGSRSGKGITVGVVCAVDVISVWGWKKPPRHIGILYKAAVFIHKPDSVGVNGEGIGLRIACCASPCAI